MSVGGAQRARVLVVDDEPGVLHATARVLQSEHEVESASSGAEAVRTAAIFRPDLLVTDIRMPGVDGFALAAELRRAFPDLDVIFMTGSRSEPDAHLVKAIQNQAFYFIEKPFDRLVLRTLVSRCLELRRLRAAERAHTAHLEAEMAEARVFQRAMLAPESGREGGVAIEACCRPCAELGGDLYDYLLAPDGRLVFIVADVRGHGASAAMMTAIVKSVFHAPSNAHEPGRVGEALAQALAPFEDDRFITCVIGAIDARAGELEWVGAGHPPMLLERAGGEPLWLWSQSPIVCNAFPSGSWSPMRTALCAGWRLLVYTDGLTDALGGAMAEQRERIAGCVAPLRGPREAARALIDLAIAGAKILPGTRAGDPPDDVTAVILTGT